jgi:hypothetical protein
MRTYSFILKIHLEMLIDERQNLHCHVSREWESFPCVIMLHQNRVIHPFVQNVYKRFNHAVPLSSSSHTPPPLLQKPQWYIECSLLSQNHA